MLFKNHPRHMLNAYINSHDNSNERQMIKIKRNTQRKQSPFNCQSTVNNTFIKQNVAIFYFAIEIFFLIEIFGIKRNHKINWHHHFLWPSINKEREQGKKTRWMHFHWHQRCGIQVVVWLHVKSIHQVNLIDRKSDEIWPKLAPKKTQY